MDQEAFRKSQNIDVSKWFMKQDEFLVQQRFVKENKNKDKTFRYFINN